MDAGFFPSPIPFAAARAYAASQPVRTQASFTTRAETTTPAGRVASGIVDQVELRSRGPVEKIRSLVAARVELSPEFAPEPARPARSDALPMYRHPADRNIAATGVRLGASLDVNA